MKNTGTPSSVFGSSDAFVLPSVAELQQSLHSNEGHDILGLLHCNSNKFQVNAVNTQGALIDYPALPKLLGQTSNLSKMNVEEKMAPFSKNISSLLPMSKVKLSFIEQTQATNSSQRNALCNPVCGSPEKLSQTSSSSMERVMHITEQTSVNSSSQLTTCTSNISQSVANFVERLNCQNDLSSAVISNGMPNSQCPYKNSAVQNWSDTGSLAATMSENFNKNWVDENQGVNPCPNVEMLPTLSSNSLTEFSDNLLSQCVEDIHCFKCKFCSPVYISLSKDDAISHIISTHTKELEILQVGSMSAVDSTVAEWLSPDQLLTPNFRNSVNLAEPANTEEGNGNCLPKTCIDATPLAVSADRNIIPQEASFICGKCQKSFFSLSECQKHLSYVHQVKSSRIRECKPNSEISKLESQPRLAEKTMSSSIKSKLNGQKLKTNIDNSSKCLGSSSGLTTGNKGKNPKLRVMTRKRLKREQGCYICEWKGCNVRFQLLDNLHYHNKCHINGNSMFACPECTTSTQRWSSMAGHLWRQHVIDLELHACDQCSFRTFSFSLLENLHKRTHGEEKPYLCDSCGKSFKTNKQLRSHKVVHQPTTGNRKNGECQICHRRFVDKRMQRIHMEMVHKKMKPYLCNYCGYSASSKSTLRMHMRQHTGEKPFCCDTCDYCTSDHNSLRRHKMRHSGEKPYKCPYCSYACIQSSTYKSHLKSKHPGQDKGLMFSCSMCCFDTIKEDSYLTHMADHNMSAVLTNPDPHPQGELDEQYISLVEAVQISLSQSSSSSGCNTSSNHSLLSALENDTFQKVPVVDNIF